MDEGADIRSCVCRANSRNFREIIWIIIVRQKEKKSVEEKAAVQHDLSCIHTRVRVSHGEARSISVIYSPFTSPCPR